MEDENIMIVTKDDEKIAVSWKFSQMCELVNNVLETEGEEEITLD